MNDPFYKVLALNIIVSTVKCKIYNLRTGKCIANIHIKYFEIIKSQRYKT